MTEPKDTWESFGDITARLAAKLEEDQRRVFERECKRDGVYSQQKRNEGVKNESVV